MSVKPIIAASIVFVLMAVCGRTASAQQPRSGYPAVFGGAAVDPNARQSAELLLTIAEAYDDNILADAGGATPTSPFQVSGFYTVLTPQISYESRGERLQFRANAGSNFRYYSELRRSARDEPRWGGRSSAPSLDHPPALPSTKRPDMPRATCTACCATRLAPSIGDLLPGGADYQTTSGSPTRRRPTRASGTRFRIARRCRSTPISTIRTSRSAPVSPTCAAYDAGGRWMYAVNRRGDASPRLHLSSGAFTSANALPAEHDVEIGIDYIRPISQTRQWAAGVGLGPTLVSGSSAPRCAQDAGRQYRFRGNVFLERQIGRSWSARGGYNRGSQLHCRARRAGVQRHGKLQAAGFLNRRTDLQVSAGYSTRRHAGAVRRAGSSRPTPATCGSGSD